MASAIIKYEMFVREQNILQFCIRKRAHPVNIEIQQQHKTMTKNESQQKASNTSTRRRKTIIMIVIVAAIVVVCGVIALTAGRRSDDGDVALTSAVAVSAPDGTVEGHGYVDLGLSVRWAFCNIGAHSPYAYGEYFAWGETKSSREFSDERCSLLGEKVDAWSGDPQHDAATARWGGAWRTPTKRELRELVNDCVWAYTTRQGQAGYIVASKKNGKTLFLPAGGRYYDDGLHSPGQGGFYWGATPFENNALQAYSISFAPDIHQVHWTRRSSGGLVRAVTEQE